MNDSKVTNKWILRGRELWLYIKYQAITKLLISIAVLPLFAVFTDYLVKNSGRTNLSSGDYLGFLLSLNGIIFVLVGLIILTLILGIDINTFIIISSLIKEKKLNMKIRNIIWISIKSVKHFFSPVGAFIVVFVALVLPLLGLGVNLGPFKDFKIPNFISSVIFANPLYNTLYTVAIFFLFVISIIYIFTLHFVLIENTSVKDGLKKSRKLVLKYWKSFIFEYIRNLIKVFLVLLVCLIISVGVLIIISFIFKSLISNEKVLLVLFFISILEIFSLFAFLTVPIVISIITKLFYKLNELDGNKISLRLENKSTVLKDEDIYRKIKIRTKVKVLSVLAIIIAFNFGIAYLSGNYFDEMFKTDINIELVAHRGGGNLGAENTIQGIKEAIKEGVNWTEIDVQRTKDGKYIINHDSTFKRVSGVDKKPSEMTLKEIKELEVKNEFYPEKPSQEVPTLEELLDVTKGKIGVFVELKGKTADEKMVDDVVKIIKDKGMLEECVILSLNYDIIEYTEKHHPEIKTGFLYFLASGKLKDLKGDYLIMEEGEAGSDNIDEIHEAGKKAVVWTVNTENSIRRFIYSDIDGIITDYPVLIKEAIAKSKERTPIEIIIDSFLIE